MNKIVYMLFGSHLYGTATELSDKDYKGIFMPSKREIFLGHIPKSINTTTKKESGEGVKNTNKDVDDEMYSLHYFIQLACEGQTVALDMLHAPSSMILESSEIWDSIQMNREKFYTKNLKAFIGYARKQVAKYGVRGSRLAEAREFLKCLSRFNGDYRLDMIWNDLPTGEYIKYLGNDPNGFPQIQVCGKIFNSRATINYTGNIIQRYVDAYGERAKQAEQNQGIDWKAVSHAVRAALQVRELLSSGTITFPLIEAQLVKDIKLGKLDYNTEASPILEELMEQVENLALISDLPESVDREYWDNFIIKCIEENL